MLFLLFLLAMPEKPSGSLYQNYQQARTILARAEAAHGGWDQGKSQQLALAIKGKLVQEGHYSVPGAVRTYPFSGRAVFDRDGRALLTSRYMQGFKEELFINQAGVFEGKPNDEVLAQVGAERGHDLTDDVCSILPQALFKLARNNAASLIRLSDHALSFSFGNERYVLNFSAGTGLLKSVERLMHTSRFGDYVATCLYTYGERNPFVVPKTVTRTEWPGTAGVTIHLDIQKATWLASFPRETQVVQSPAENIRYLGHDTWLMSFPEQESRALFMAFADHIVVFEGVGDSALGERVIAAIKETVPDKPIRFLAISHFHPAYTWGIRPYVAEGVTLITSPGNEDYIRGIVAAPYTIKPDRLAAHPREPKFHMVTKPEVLDDGHQRLEIYNIDKDSAHTDENLLFYLPKLKIIYQADLVLGYREGGLRPASKRAKGVYKHIKAQKLAVETIYASWLSERFKESITMAELEQMMAMVKTSKK